MKKFWFKIDDKIRFILVGGFNFLVSYLIYSFFCIALGTGQYQIALALAWALSSIVSFSTQKLLVFKGGENWLKEYLKCCGTWFVSYLINALSLEIFVKYLHINVFISQILATIICAIFTYCLFKMFAFKTKNKEL